MGAANTELEFFKMVKKDVLEERVNNHIKFFWAVIVGIVGVLAYQAVKLNSISGQLGELQGLKEKVTALAIQTQADAPQPVFESTLANLRSTVTDAREENVKVSSKVIDALQRKLLATRPDAPDFWPTLADFISYRSSLSYSSSIAPTPPKAPFLYSFTDIPNCTDSLPKPLTIKEVVNPSLAIPNRGLYEKCRFVLDDPKQDQVLNDILKKTTPLITFKNCLIQYHGGDINLILAWDKAAFTVTLQGTGPEDPTRTIQTQLSGPAIQFENCLFDFEFENSPPTKGQQISTALLAQDASSVSLPVSP